MAPKKQNRAPPKPEKEVSEEEEDPEEEEEEGDQKQPKKSKLSLEEGEEESDEEEEVHTPINHQIHSSFQDVKNSSDVEGSESEEEEDDDDDNEEPELTNTVSEYPFSPTTSDFTIRPITSAPKGSKPTSKRLLDFQRDDGKQSGIKKKAKTGEEDEKKGKSVASPGRIWSEEKEIAMLRGIINYQKKKGPLRYADMGAFHEFIQGKLWDGVSKNQVADKVKRCKGKYFANVKKGENGNDPHFSKPYEKKVFNLSGQIWGGVNESNGIVNKAKVTSQNGKARKGSNGGKESIKTEDDVKVKNSVKRKKESVSGSESVNVDGDGKNKHKKGSDLMNLDGKEDFSKDHSDDLSKDGPKEDEEKDFLTKFPHLSKSVDAKMGSFKDKIYLIGSKKAMELDERWKKLQIEEMDLVAEELRLQAEQTEVVLDAMKKSRGDCLSQDTLLLVCLECFGLIRSTT